VSFPKNFGMFPSKSGPGNIILSVLVVFFFHFKHKGRLVLSDMDILLLSFAFAVRAEQCDKFLHIMEQQT